MVATFPKDNADLCSKERQERRPVFVSLDIAAVEKCCGKWCRPPEPTLLQPIDAHPLSWRQCPSVLGDFGIGQFHGSTKAPERWRVNLAPAKGVSLRLASCDVG